MGGVSYLGNGMEIDVIDETCTYTRDVQVTTRINGSD